MEDAHSRGPIRLVWAAAGPKAAPGRGHEAEEPPPKKERKTKEGGPRSLVAVPCFLVGDLAIRSSIYGPPLPIPMQLHMACLLACRT